jgi:hypothetical protein
MADLAASSDPAETLRRELYWAQAGVKHVRADTLWVRDQFSAFALQRRIEESEPRPLGDGTLDARSDARRAVKLGVWRVVRFATRRYDRLLGELAELTTSLAERVIAAEDEVERLRAELQELRDRP